MDSWTVKGDKDYDVKYPVEITINIITFVS